MHWFYGSVILEKGSHEAPVVEAVLSALAIAHRALEGKHQDSVP